MVKEVGGGGDQSRIHSPKTVQQPSKVITTLKSTAYEALNKSVDQWSKAYDKKSSPTNFRHSVSTNNAPGAKAVSKAAERPLPGPQRSEMCERAYSVAGMTKKTFSASARMFATLGATKDSKVRLPIDFNATRSAAFDLGLRSLHFTDKERGYSNKTKTAREEKKTHRTIRENSDTQGPGTKGSDTGRNKKGRP